MCLIRNGQVSLKLLRLPCKPHVPWIPSSLYILSYTPAHQNRFIRNESRTTFGVRNYSKVNASKLENRLPIASDLSH